MAPTVELLPAIEIDGHRPGSGASAAHPLRTMTRQLAGLEAGDWNPDVRAGVAALFDQLAPGWHTRNSPQWTAVMRDALERGLDPLVERTDLCVEIGSGTGFYSGFLTERFDLAVSVEIAFDMLSNAPTGPAQRVLADGGELPVADGSVDAAVMVNSFLFPHEVARILRPGGVVLWVNSNGPDSPIHLATAELIEALPFEAAGREARAGAGTWVALERVG